MEACFWYRIIFFFFFFFTNLDFLHENEEKTQFWLSFSQFISQFHHAIKNKKGNSNLIAIVISQFWLFSQFIILQIWLFFTVYISAFISHNSELQGKRSGSWVAIILYIFFKQASLNEIWKCHKCRNGCGLRSILSVHTFAGNQNHDLGVVSTMLFQLSYCKNMSAC